jgi:molybdopterin-guanine dinucleotide biosynthesis protein B
MRFAECGLQNDKPMRVVSFVAAASNSGKTTLIAKVVPLLKKRGLHVAVVKHASAGFDLDKPGKDSQRFQEAGADSVVLVGPKDVALMRKTEYEPTAEELEHLTSDADIVIFEGFKKTAKNKIEVFRHGISGERPLCMNDPSFIALASDKQFDVSLPRFDINDAEGIAAFLVEYIMAA